MLSTVYSCSFSFTCFTVGCIDESLMEAHFQTFSNSPLDGIITYTQTLVTPRGKAPPLPL